METIQFWATTLEFFGSIMIAIAVFMVLNRFRQEHTIDRKVIRALEQEHIVGFIGIIAIVAGYLLQILPFLRP